MKARALLISAFVAVFLLGVMTGVAASTRWGRAAVEQRAWQAHAGKGFQRLAAELELTEEQRAKIRPRVFEAFRKQRQSFREIRREFRSMEADIMQELTPPQQEKLRAIQAKWDRIWQKGDRDKRPDGARDRPGEGPPPPPPLERERRD